jgi:uncharacterized protein YjbI with pentapeptide repeats
MRRKLSWPRTTRQKAILWVVLLSLLIFVGYTLSWTGFGRGELRAEERPPKLLWDWLQLLIVPLVLVLAGFWLSSLVEKVRQSIEAERAQDEALQAYLDQMRDLLLGTGLREAKEEKVAEARTLARAQTLTLMRRLDASRKASVIQFLDEAGLIQSNPYKYRKEDIESSEQSPVVALNDADLSRVDLSRAKLRFVYMRRTKLSEANLRGAKLRGADLRAADLRGAKLSGAYLGSAKLRRADLSGANLSNADLNGAYRWVKGKGRAVKPHKELVANEELVRQASSLEGATMPNGQKYEEWLKEKEGGGKDE